MVARAWHPHEARSVAAVEASPDETPSAAVEKPAAKPASAGVPITPVVAPPPTPDEPVTTEEIIIEIDGND